MASKPLFAFFGTPKFAVDVLNALEKHGLLPAVVITAPDKPRGRGLELSPAPAKLWAVERGIDVLTPSKVVDSVEELQNTDWDVFVVAAYNKLLPKKILGMPRRGVLNVHPSLLPKFRGPSPALSAILADERVTGVSILLMNEKMDEGDIVAQARVELEEDAWPPKGSLFEELLATEGGNLLAETLPLWIAGDITPEPQDHSKATFSRKFIDADAQLEIDEKSLPTGRQAREALLKIRAFDKGPRAYFKDATGKRVIVTEAQWLDPDAQVGAGGKLELLKVIPEGKKELLYKDFLKNHSI